MAEVGGTAPGGRTVEPRLWNALRHRAGATPESPMLVTEQETVSFGEVHDRALAVAAGLHGRGVRSGAVVSWQLPTWTETVVLLAALSRLGAVQNPLLPMLRTAEVAFITAQTGASLLIVPSLWRGHDYAGMAHEVAVERPGLDVLVADRTLPAGDPADLPPQPVDGDEVRWNYYTSGTAAAPKGARHADATVMAAARCMSAHVGITAADRIACVFPFTHIAGAVYVATAVMTGCAMALLEAFDPEESPGVLSELDVTLVGAGTPFHLAYLSYQRAHPDRAPLFPKARAFLGGGAPKPPSLHHRVKGELGGVGIVSGYGLTEAPILTMGRLTDSDEELAHTEGAPGPGVELRFVGADGDDVAAGRDGEILVRAPQLMHGYVDPSLDEGAFADGWFRTGDLGHLSPAGNVVVTGRAKDIIIRNMENISAKEVEDLLVEHPAVAEAAVIGLPDDRTGERVCAVVVPLGDADVSVAELAEFVVGRGLAIQKAAEQVEIVDALPRNSTGKVQKNVLCDRFSDMGD